MDIDIKFTAPDIHLLRAVRFETLHALINELKYISAPGNSVTKPYSTKMVELKSILHEIEQLDTRLKELK